MCFVVLTGFHLYGQYFAVKFNDKIQFAALLVVVIIRNDAVCHQFLRYGILIDGTEIDVLVSFDNPHLDALRVLAGQQPDVVLKELEQIARTRKQERHFRLFHIIYGQCHASIGQPQETVLDPVKLRMFVQPFQDKTLVPGVQLGRNQIENLLDI